MSFDDEDIDEAIAIVEYKLQKEAGLLAWNGDDSIVVDYEYLVSKEVSDQERLEWIEKYQKSDLLKEILPLTQEQIDNISGINQCSPD